MNNNEGITFLNSFYNSHNPAYFGMVVTHLLDRGFSYFDDITEEDIEAAYQKQKQDEEREERETHLISMFSAGFCRDLNMDALKMSRNVSPVTLLQWYEVNKLYDVKGIRKA